ncbi:MAG: BtaA family protein [bacterium]|nr:BtaA family protein [bacterium]
MASAITQKFSNYTKDKIFRTIHGNHLIYNTSWEDPAIDRKLMDIDENSDIVMITSAGDNLLDYLLDRPASINSVDVNPKQNALFELKRAVIRTATHEDLYRMFGDGCHPDIQELYRTKLRDELPAFAREFWDKKLKFFEREGLKKSFYFYGGAGTLAWLCQGYFKLHKKLNENIRWLFSAQTMEEQQQAYDRLEPLLWNRVISWFLGRHITLAAMGVPRAQRDLIMNGFEGGLLGFLRTNVRRVFTEVPVSENYFWRVYATGTYTRECAPGYLREKNFQTLKETVDSANAHTTTMVQFLKDNPKAYSHYVLLDHQDWLAWNDPAGLEEEWRLILQNSKPGTKILLRSASPAVDFLPDFVRAAVDFEFEGDRATELHQTCRVGTYGSLMMGTVRA